MNGNTFSAEIAHGPLKLGDVVTGGYAVASIGDICTTFKVHQPRRVNTTRRSLRPKRKTRRAF